MYGIKPNNKYQQYQIILDNIKDYSIEVNKACSLPGLSGFAFENTLTEEYPDVSITCFEAKYQYYKQIVPDAPKNVYLYNGNVEDYYPNKSSNYDLLWLDYCGRCNLVQPELVYYLNKRSIFAITECKSHGIKPLILGKEAKLLTHYEYGHMRFRCYFIGPEFHKKYSQLISNIS